MQNVAKLELQFDTMRTTKDGGGKITFEFSQDQMQEIQKVLRWNGIGEVNFVVVVTPLNPQPHNEHENLEY